MKETYTSIYSFLVMGKLTEGAKIYVLDRKEKTVELLNDKTITKALVLLKDAEKNEERYLFWTEKES